MIRGGKMCQIVEGHNITVPLKKWGAIEALFTNFQKKWGGKGLFRLEHVSSMIVLHCKQMIENILSMQINLEITIIWKLYQDLL